MTAGPRGIPVDARPQAAERLWATGDVTGLWLLTHAGKYQGEVVAANILGLATTESMAVHRVVCTDPQGASVGAHEAAVIGTAMLSGVAKTATCTHADAESTASSPFPCCATPSSPSPPSRRSTSRR